MIKKYWKARSSLLYISCADISHNCLKRFKNRTIQYIIYISAQKKPDHKCEVIKYIVKRYKFFIKIIPKYTSCRRNHQMNKFRYLTGLQAQTQAWKEKIKNVKLKANSQPQMKVLKRISYKI